MIERRGGVAATVYIMGRLVRFAHGRTNCVSKLAVAPVSPRCRRLLAWAWLVTGLWGGVEACASRGDGDVFWSIDFACAHERALAAQVVSRISKGDCSASSAPVYEVASVREGASVEAVPGEFAPGPYAFHASALDASGKEIARACVQVVLPNEEPIELVLYGEAACDATATATDPAGVSNNGELRDADASIVEDAAIQVLDDGDRDGTPDLRDGCPADANKVTAGSCGCGFLESLTDQDADGLADCFDACPRDSTKVKPLQCGCGRPDTDSDSDGTADCIDLCATDPHKTAQGLCGCGRRDTDGDADTVPDCLDSCPSDPGKIAAGACGCGVSDADADGDRTADCLDSCPYDSGKIAAGMCGCGVSELDADHDGTPNCLDACPNDGGKRQPGICGCGRSDADTDGDHTEDCRDVCVYDPDRIVPGVCGCGVPDSDSDGDGVIDCPAAASCGEILSRYPQVADGVHTVDPDGYGPYPSLSVTCDMSGGGWTVISREDFGKEGAGGWHSPDGVPTRVDTSSTCAASYGPMLGGLGILGRRAETLKAFDLRHIPHTELRVSMDYIVLEGWDSESAVVYVDNVERYRSAFNHRMAPGNVCGNAKRKDHGPQPVEVRVAHSANSTQVRVTSTLDAGAKDKAFGVDNVVVRIR